MNSKQLSRQEYTNRINRVMDYIEHNLDKTVDLSILAGIASFSPFHFHRIFTAMVGETPNNFVSRIRLERAAQLLHNDPKTSVSDIAFACGFVNISSFSRAFKGHFNITTTEFRNQDRAIFIKNGVRYSKIGKAVRKIGKNYQQINEQFCSVELNQLIIMDTKIEIKQMPELNLIYCRHTGAFNKIGQAYEKLFNWASPRGLVKQGTKTVTVYHDDPAITSIDKIRQDASIIVDGNVKVDGEIGKSKIPSGKYAVGRFEINVTEFEEAWNTMCAWFTESGYQSTDGPTYEYYHSDCSENPEHKFIVDICIPIKPL